MSRPAISTLKLNDHLSISECHPDSECRVNNWWLYDERSGMNIGMREETRDDAFIEAIEYWAKMAQRFEKSYTELKSQVDSFVGQFIERDEDWDD